MKNVLIGRTLTGLKIADDKSALLFQTNKGDITALCWGDCCSETWVENIETPARGLPALVLAVENLEMPDLGDMPGRDVVEYYGLRVTTDKGELIIDYRNDSNGYYQGNLSWPGDAYYEESGSPKPLNWVDVIG